MLDNIGANRIITKEANKPSIKEKEEQVSKISEQIATQDKANEELEDVLNDENESAYMEQYAREELDYIMPGERVYANSAS